MSPASQLGTSLERSLWLNTANNVMDLLWIFMSSVRRRGHEMMVPLPHPLHAELSYGKLLSLDMTHVTREGKRPTGCPSPGLHAQSGKRVKSAACFPVPLRSKPRRSSRMPQRSAPCTPISTNASQPVLSSPPSHCISFRLRSRRYRNTLQITLKIG